MKGIRQLLQISMVAVMVMTAGSALSQNSLPAPGTGGTRGGNGGSPQPPNGIGWNPGPGFGGGGPMWGGANMMGGPWCNDTWTQPFTNGIPTQGSERVVACGYDAQGVWRLVPMLVDFQYNGVQYNVEVINAWNPWTDMWNRNIDQPAYNTDYWLKNIQYDYYVPLSTGTYYFNL